MFDILVCDPPWSYKRKSTGGTNKSSSTQHYDTMTKDVLIGLNDFIYPLMKENSVIFLWTTVPMLQDAMELLWSWDYKYKTMITWIKSNYGLGNWFRGKTEHMLFGVRGKVKPFYVQAPNIIYTVEDEKLEHSQKPSSSYRLVLQAAEKMGPDTKVLELFARRDRRPYGLDWTAIGKDISGNDIVEDLKKIK